MANQKLKSIVAPSLTQPGYGRGIDNQFKAIEENFKILGNRDFVKGDRGYSVRSNTIYLSTWSNIGRGQKQLILTKYGIRVIDAILKEYCLGKGLLDLMRTLDSSIKSLPDTLPVGVVGKENNIKGTLRYYLSNNNSTHTSDSWQSIRPLQMDKGQYLSIADAFDGGKTPDEVDYEKSVDNYIKLNSFKIIETYDPAETNKVYTPVASIAHWVFRDHRFATVNISQNDIEKYSGLVDTSCTVHLLTIDDDYNADFTVLHDIPALYFDKDNNSFCWLLGNQKTGMIAQGPRGLQGDRSRFFIFKAEKTREADNGVYVAKYYKEATSNTEWKEITKDTNTSEFRENDPCIVCVPVKVKDNSGALVTKSQFFYSIISNVDIDDGTPVIKIYCSTESKVPDIFTEDDFKRFFSQSIGFNKAIRGLYVPFNPSSNPYSYKHLIWSEATGANGNIFDTLHIGPTHYGTMLGNAEPAAPKVESKNLYNPNGKLYIEYPEITFGFPQITSNSTKPAYPTSMKYSNGNLSIGGNLHKIEFITNPDNNVNNTAGRADVVFTDTLSANNIKKLTFGLRSSSSGYHGWVFSGNKECPLVANTRSFIISDNQNWTNGKRVTIFGSPSYIQAYDGTNVSDININTGGGITNIGATNYPINIYGNISAHNGLNINNGDIILNRHWIKDVGVIQFTSQSSVNNAIVDGALITNLNDGGIQINQPPGEGEKFKQIVLYGETHIRGGVNMSEGNLQVNDSIIANKYIISHSDIEGKNIQIGRDLKFVKPTHSWEKILTDHRPKNDNDGGGYPPLDLGYKDDNSNDQEVELKIKWDDLTSDNFNSGVGYNTIKLKGGLPEVRKWRPDGGYYYHHRQTDIILDISGVPECTICVLQLCLLVPHLEHLENNVNTVWDGSIRVRFIENSSTDEQIQGTNEQCWFKGTLVNDGPNSSNDTRKQLYISGLYYTGLRGVGAGWVNIERNIYSEGEVEDEVSVNPEVPFFPRPGLNDDLRLDRDNSDSLVDAEGNIKGNIIIKGEMDYK